MFQNLDVFQTAMSMARHAGHMQAMSAQNIANADTPGYRARQLPSFKDSLAQQTRGQKATRARHLHGATGRQVAPDERRAARMARESGDDPATLRSNVTSKGGTTAAGLERFEAGGLDALVEQAVTAAAGRASELGDELGGA